MFNKISQIATVLVLALLGTVARSHMCLVFPMQRGPIPSLMAGYDKNCGHMGQATGYKCPYKAGKPVAVFKAGVPETMLLQQNINHENPMEPGYFDVQVSYDKEMTWQTISNNVSDFPTNQYNTQTFLDVTVTFPKVAMHAAIRARYVTNNQEGTFYQCADVKVVKAVFPKTNTVVADSSILPNSFIKNLSTETIAKNNFSCVSPTNFIASGTKTTFVQGGGYHVQSEVAIYWMGNEKLLRHDEKVGMGKNKQTLSHITKTANLVDYAFTSTTDCNCNAGIDKLASPPYQFGAQVGMTYQGMKGNQAQFAIPSANLYYGVHLLGGGKCTPKWILHGNTFTHFWASKNTTTFPKNTFKIPNVGTCRPVADPTKCHK